jgi:tryptophan 7-halogenase
MAIERLVIVGGGTAGWMAAAAMARAFGQKLSVTVVESDDIGTVGVGEATIPQLHLFNRFLGIDEDGFMRATMGSFKLGIEFVDWYAKGTRYLHAFGGIGKDIGLIPFHHYWVRAHHMGYADHLWDYSPNTEAAKQLRFARTQATGALAGLSWAFHFDAALYAKFLRAYAEERGITRLEGKITHVSQDAETGFISAVTTERGDRVAGDLFIDCSGFRGLLIEQTLQAGYEDWTHLLPCDRAVAVPCKNGGDFTPYTRATARDAGWQWRIPLQHRTGNGYVFCSSFISEDEATATLMANLDGPALAEPRVIRFQTGRRKAFWAKNVVALGLASGFMEPLESTSIHLIQAGIDKLIRLFPRDNIEATAVDEYNRQATAEFTAIRNFLIFHYTATMREDTPFWRHCQAIARPDSLSAKVALFAESGRLHRDQDDLFPDLSWLQVLIGQGVMPRSYHPLADQLKADQLSGLMRDLRAIVAQEISVLPTHTDFIARHCSTQKDF